MKIKKDDKVIVLTGKDKGKTGAVVKVFVASNKVLVSGINVSKVHVRARRSGEKGQIVEKNSPIHASNVSLIDPKSGKATRIGTKTIDGKKVRVAKKSNTTL
ncbi:MAG: 50S ribosomal protein L24 [Candidatus Zambryskibacteria bacterium]|nr:50S ribosomal protein L24 [Candidatus Zambryskibacteria bacterium]